MTNFGLERWFKMLKHLNLLPHLIFFRRWGKKHSIFIHSIDFIQKFVKYELLRGKKYGIFTPRYRKSTPKNLKGLSEAKKQTSEAQNYSKLTFRGQIHSKWPKIDSKCPKSFPIFLRWKNHWTPRGLKSNRKQKRLP